MIFMVGYILYEEIIWMKYEKIKRQEEAYGCRFIEKAGI